MRKQLLPRGLKALVLLVALSARAIAFDIEAYALELCANQGTPVYGSGVTINYAISAANALGITTVRIYEVNDGGWGDLQIVRLDATTGDIFSNDIVGEMSQGDASWREFEAAALPDPGDDFLGVEADPTAGIEILNAPGGIYNQIRWALSPSGGDLPEVYLRCPSGRMLIVSRDGTTRWSWWPTPPWPFPSPV